jgi:carbamoyl-phosphate synthase small subunit
VTHRSLFDGSVQGLERTDKPAFCFQGHPEASPGPHDIAPLFDRFISLMEKNSTGLTGLHRIDRINSVLVKQ